MYPTQVHQAGDGFREDEEIYVGSSLFDMLVSSIIKVRDKVKTQNSYVVDGFSLNLIYGGCSIHWVSFGSETERRRNYHEVHELKMIY